MCYACRANRGLPHPWGGSSATRNHRHKPYLLPIPQDLIFEDQLAPARGYDGLGEDICLLQRRQKGHPALHLKYLVAQYESNHLGPGKRLLPCRGCLIWRDLTAPSLNCTISECLHRVLAQVAAGVWREAASPPLEDQATMSHNQRIGRWGEAAAADYLTARGYDIVGRNIRTPFGEIDLLARIENLTVFVEVKARTTRSLGPPEIAVGQQKQAHMKACAEHYAQQNQIDHWRIDVIAVERIREKAEITHFENAVS